jgi:hypothetical protein
MAAAAAHDRGVMIWSDAWSLAATDWRSDSGGFNTTLPPPAPSLPVGVSFRCVRWCSLSEAEREEWISVVGTGWTLAELIGRLENAWIPWLSQGPKLVGTAVFRPGLGGRDKHWLLETLRGRGFGRLLMEAGRRWLWIASGGPYVLAFVWELSVPGLVGAWARGWMRSCVALQRGWVFATSGCSFCPHDVPVRLTPRPATPLMIQTGDGAWAIVNDSGADDGWGHVCQWGGAVDWTAVAKKGGWGRLWARAEMAPSAEWRWSGEFVVVAALNGRPALDWVSAEVA